MCWLARGQVFRDCGDFGLPCAGRPRSPVLGRRRSRAGVAAFPQRSAVRPPASARHPLPGPVPAAPHADVHDPLTRDVRLVNDDLARCPGRAAGAGRERPSWVRWAGLVRLPAGRGADPDRIWDQPISSSGPTASKAALPYSPVIRGSATFNASVTMLEKMSRRRADFSTPSGPPCRAMCRVPSKTPTTDRSTAWATKGATQIGTPRRSLSASTLPNVRPTTIPITAVTRFTAGAGPTRSAERMFDPCSVAIVSAFTGHRPWSAAVWRPGGR